MQISLVVTAKLISAFVFCYSDSTIPLLLKSENFKLLALSCACTGWFVSDLYGNHIVGFPTRRLGSIMLFIHVGSSKRKWWGRDKNIQKKQAHELDNGLVPLPAKVCFICRK